MKVVEFVPHKKVVWLVLDSHFSFTGDKTEWKDTRISFEISGKGDKTQLLFTHEGLVPKYECYDVCNDAWNDLIKISLRGLIMKGKGRPNPREANGFTNKQVKRWKLLNV
jgi:hypothetical protein